MDFILYLFKVNIAIILFYGIFRLLFQTDTFFRWKRFTLLAIIFISFSYPAINITRQVIANNQLNNFMEAITIPVYNLSEVIITVNANSSVTPLPKILLSIYIIVSVLLFIRVLIQSGIIVYKLRRTTKTELFGQFVYESQGLKTPYSFFNWIVLDSSRYSETELQEILLHESAHVEQKHSFDTILAELLCVLCWFNPFVWLLRTEIRMNLEFLADRSVLSSGCGAEHYQFHLLRLSYNKTAVKITNNFNVSLLKKRIFMMNKKQTSLRSIWKYTLLLPIIALLLIFNSTCQSNTKSDKETVTEQPNTETAVEQVIIQEIELFEQETPVRDKDKPHIFSYVDQMPSFPGGDTALMKWLGENVTYPKEAQEQGISGIVVLKFVITSDGSVEEVEIVKSLHQSCDKEAFQAMKKMPKWNPGKQKGEPVNVYFTLPVRFKL